MVKSIQKIRIVSTSRLCTTEKQKLLTVFLWNCYTKKHFCTYKQVINWVRHVLSYVILIARKRKIQLSLEINRSLSIKKKKMEAKFTLPFTSMVYHICAYLLASPPSYSLSLLLSIKRETLWRSVFVRNCYKVCSFAKDERKVIFIDRFITIIVTNPFFQQYNHWIASPITIYAVLSLAFWSRIYGIIFV